MKKIASSIDLFCISINWKRWNSIRFHGAYSYSLEQVNLKGFKERARNLPHKSIDYKKLYLCNRKVFVIRKSVRKELGIGNWENKYILHHEKNPSVERERSKFQVVYNRSFTSLSLYFEWRTRKICKVLLLFDVLIVTSFNEKKISKTNLNPWKSSHKKEPDELMKPVQPAHSIGEWVVLYNSKEKTQNSKQMYTFLPDVIFYSTTSCWISDDGLGNWKHIRLEAWITFFYFLHLKYIS